VFPWSSWRFRGHINVSAVIPARPVGKNSRPVSGDSVDIRMTASFNILQ
jgi:hypothetical protein